MGSYKAILPELVLGLLGMLVLIVDMFLPKDRGMEVGKRNGILTALCIAGLVVAWVGAYASRGHAPPWWAQTQITVDLFGIYFKIVVILSAVLVLLTTPHYVMRRITSGQGEFYALLIFAALGMSLMAVATDFISIYVALEFTSITCYILAGYMRRDPKSAESGLKYFLIGVVSSGIMLYGMSLIYGLLGSTRLSDIAKGIENQAIGWQNPLLTLALILVLAGFAFKLAIVPFHQWAPDTYEGGPTPFIAYLSVAPKAAGFALAMRVFSTAFGEVERAWAFWMAIIAALTMTVGNLAAIPQTNLKRMLAYSSIAQAGYMIVGLAAYTMSPDDRWMRTTGILLYLLTYVFMNVGAFAVAILVSQDTNSDEIAACRWLSKRNSLAALAFLVFVWSLAGLPPMAGFPGKWLLFSAAMDSGLTWLALVMAANTVISVFYYFNVVRIMFFPPPEPGETMALPQEPRPLAASPPMQLALVLSIAGTLVIGIYPQPFIELAQQCLLPHMQTVAGVVRVWLGV